MQSSVNVTHLLRKHAFISSDFPSKPPLPPSTVQFFQRKRKTEETNTSFLKSLRVLIRDIGFILQASAYGINIGVLVSVSTLLNQFVLQYFPVSRYI